MNNHHYARQNSITASGAGGRAAIGPGGLMLGVGEAGGVKEYSVRFRMVIKVDAGINKYAFQAPKVSSNWCYIQQD